MQSENEKGVLKKYFHIIRREFSSVGLEHPDFKVGRVTGSIFLFWEFSSVGLEHLPYKQRVTGSTPVTPTTASQKCGVFLWVLMNCVQ